MTIIHHINCGTLLVPGYPTVVCHCLLLEDPRGLALVDTGIGLKDVHDPVERLGQDLIDLAGFQFHEEDTAVRRIEALGFSAEQVKHVILTHGDPDHAGGLADFPQAQVHLASEELAHIRAGHRRYVARQFAHGPNWQSLEPQAELFFGLHARRVPLGFASEVLLVPLFGHTLGHCGVAIQQGERWQLHVGDAYYLRAELMDEDHPVSALAAQRADSDELRLASLRELQRLQRDHSDMFEMVGTHDIRELEQFSSSGHDHQQRAP